jgi:peptidoglycan/LPS O-acetylase OafA/YrhL
MGTLRLILALLVLLSHAGVRVHQLNPGVTAVIGFYLISGYVMAGLVHRHYDRVERVPFFYVDRVLRLFPQYLLYAGLTLAWYLATGTATQFLQHAPSARDLLFNLLVVPLNFYMYNGSDAFTLIPPAWSLGAELQFYLLVPFMLIFPRFGVVAAMVSAGVHVLALHGKLNTDWYGYRLLAGVLWVFGIGMLLFHWQRSRPAWARAVAMAAPVLALAVYAYLRSRGLHAAPYHQEVLVGWGVGVPLVHWLSQRRSGAWDHWAGDVSYGVFLNHFLLIWLLFPAPVHTPAQLAVLAACSLCLSALSQRFIERPVLAQRRQLRVRPATELKSVM